MAGISVHGEGTPTLEAVHLKGEGVDTIAFRVNRVGDQVTFFLTHKEAVELVGRLQGVAQKLSDAVRHSA